jgi:hypothetical protein
VAYRFGRFFYEWQPRHDADAQAAWDVVDIMLSLVGTYWLFLTWRLLSRYPRESVDRAFFTITTAIVGAGATILGMVGRPSPMMLDKLSFLFDGILACVGLVLIGVTMVAKLKPLRVRPVSAGLLRIGILAFYLAWGGLQPFYPLWKGSQVYLSSLLACAMGALLMTVVYCALSLEDRYDGHPAPGV